MPFAEPLSEAFRLDAGVYLWPENQHSPYVLAVTKNIYYFRADACLLKFLETAWVTIFQ